MFNEQILATQMLWRRGNIVELHQDGNIIVLEVVDIREDEQDVLCKGEAHE